MVCMCGADGHLTCGPCGGAGATTGAGGRGCRHRRGRHDRRRHVRAGRRVHAGVQVRPWLSGGHLHGLHVRRRRAPGVRSVRRRGRDHGAGGAGAHRRRGRRGRRHRRGWHDRRRHVRAGRRVHAGVQVRPRLSGGRLQRLHVRRRRAPDVRSLRRARARPLARAARARSTGAGGTTGGGTCAPGDACTPGYKCDPGSPAGTCNVCMCGADGHLTCGPCGGTGATAAAAGGAGGTGGTASGPCQVNADAVARRRACRAA